MDQQPETASIISRKDAAAQQLERYFTGKPCKGGHLSERKVSNGACIACAKAYAAAHYRKRMDADPDAVRTAVNAAVKRHYENHRQEILDKKRQYYLDNAEAIKQRVRDARARRKAAPLANPT